MIWAKNKGPDQTADAQADLRLCCSHPTKSGFLATRPIPYKSETLQNAITTTRWIIFFILLYLQSKFRSKGDYSSASSSSSSLLIWKYRSSYESFWEATTRNQSLKLFFFKYFFVKYFRYLQSKLVFDTGLKIRMPIGNLISSFLTQNICCGYSKEPSQWDSSFEHPKHLF